MSIGAVIAVTCILIVIAFALTIARTTTRLMNVDGHIPETDGFIHRKEDTKLTLMILIALAEKSRNVKGPLTTKRRNTGKA